MAARSPPRRSPEKREIGCGTSTTRRVPGSSRPYRPRETKRGFKWSAKSPSLRARTKPVSSETRSPSAYSSRSSLLPEERSEIFQSLNGDFVASWLDPPPDRRCASDDLNVGCKGFDYYVPF